MPYVFDSTVAVIGRTVALRTVARKLTLSDVISTARTSRDLAMSVCIKQDSSSLDASLSQNDII